MSTEKKLRELLHRYQETVPAPWRRHRFSLGTQDDQESGLSITKEIAFSGIRVAAHRGLEITQKLYATPRGYVLVAHGLKAGWTSVTRVPLRELGEFYPNLVAAAIQEQGD